MNKTKRWVAIVGTGILSMWLVGYIHEKGRESGIAAANVQTIEPRETVDPLAEPRSGDEPRDLFAEIANDTDVLISKQSADGVTNADVTVEVAERIGDYTIERTRFHTERYLDEIGSSESADGITGETVLVPQNGTNYIIVRAYAKGVNFAATFMAIEGSELTRVLCQNERADQTVFLQGKCAETVKTEIGLTLPFG